MRTVYIAHPIAGSVEKNVRRIEIILEHVLTTRTGVYPIAPYLDACRYLDDAKVSDRARAFKQNKRWFESGLIDELWVCGGHSNGVREEIEWARLNLIDIKFKNFDTLIESVLETEERR